MRQRVAQNFQIRFPYNQANHLPLFLHLEFKEIRKEWKAKKKEEETLRKQDDERARQDAGQPQDGNSGQPAAQYAPTHMLPPQMGGPQLPPIGYGPAAGQGAGQYPGQGQVDGSQQQQYAAGQMYGGGAYPQSPYAQGNPMYQQRMSSC